MENIASVDAAAEVEFVTSVEAAAAVEYIWYIAIFDAALFMAPGRILKIVIAK